MSTISAIGSTAFLKGELAAPSQSVLRRDGFTPYGVARSSILLDGSWRDGLLWERILGD